MTIKWNQVAFAGAMGFLLGAVFSNFYTLRHMPGGPPFGPGRPPFGKGGPVEMFNRELDLTGPQKERLSAIFEKYKAEMDKVMEAGKPQMEVIRQRLKAEIATILTPEQVKKMDKIEEEMRAGHEKFGGPLPPRGHGGPLPPPGPGGLK
ncbi:MAG TPA: hypothetical protein PKI19_12400 [Elusimicrobiales bacterium]|nr:hypothetical protein [Elusimicrobiales bacterium]